MKKTIILLAVALMAIPAWASVTVTGSDLGGLQGTITYSFSGSPSPKVRAFALNISVDGGAVITGVTAGTSKYSIYPGTIVISGNSVTNPGTPVAVQSQLPGDTLAGLNSSGVTLEMASLYVGDANAPATSDTLVTITVDKPCNVSIAANVSRGGVVMEDLSAITPTLTGFAITQATPGCTSCWFDQDGDGYVTFDDLLNFLGQLNPTAPDYYFETNADSICFDADQDGYVTFDDLLNMLGQLNPTAPDYYYQCP